MYENRNKDSENIGYCMQMMQMMHMMHMSMMKMPMMNMPMMNMPMDDEDEDDDDHKDDKDLKKMYPKSYMIIHPMVKKHCDMMVSMHGIMHCPSNEEMEHMCKEISDKYEKHHRDEDDQNENDETRQIGGYGGNGFGQDLIRILFLRELFGRRRRRRRRPNYGY